MDNELSSALHRAKDDLADALTRGHARAIKMLRVRYDAVQSRWKTQTQAQIEQIKGTATAPAPPGILNANIYPFPPAPVTSGVGICLSGGGSRAASASMGELRGLRALPVN